VTVETPVIPGADADEEAAAKPAGTVIAIRRAGIRVIVVIAPLAIWRAVIAVISGSNHRGADAHSNTDLGARRDRSERKNYKQCQQNPT
jgi:hypothetical protein